MFGLIILQFDVTTRICVSHIIDCISNVTDYVLVLHNQWKLNFRKNEVYFSAASRRGVATCVAFSSKRPKRSKIENVSLGYTPVVECVGFPPFGDSHDRYNLACLIFTRNAIM